MGNDDAIATPPSTNGHLISPALTPLEEPHLQKLNGFHQLHFAPETTHGALKDADGHGDTFAECNNEIFQKDRSHSTPAQDAVEPAEEIKNEPPARSKTTDSLVEPKILGPNSAVRKLSAARIQELTSSPNSLPLRAAIASDQTTEERIQYAIRRTDENGSASKRKRLLPEVDSREYGDKSSNFTLNGLQHRNAGLSHSRREFKSRPRMSSRAASTPSPIDVRDASSIPEKPLKSSLGVPRSEQGPDAKNFNISYESASKLRPPASYMPLPIPPLSMPTFLQLELSDERPSPLYIHPAESSEFPYESSRVKFERLVNFLSIPPQLERTMLFGTLACLDAWLYSITILPLRFLKSMWTLLMWSIKNSLNEWSDLTNFIYGGLGRLWRRRRLKDVKKTHLKDDKPRSKMQASKQATAAEVTELDARMKHVENVPDADIKKPRQTQRQDTTFAHKRTQSKPYLLLPNHKADILQGFLIIACSTILMRFDTSIMYHTVKGQSFIKLYVIYNGLEVCDRLFSALGQDIMECLFSRDTLGRNSQGRSRVLRPLWLFLLALIYAVIHSSALLFQVVTLNVAVNSYSNALLTLLISNQFVEIKGSVFKRIEKENLFQLTCADVVERFQLWIMLLIIALRNLVEMGGFKISFGDVAGSSGPLSATAGNGSDPASRFASILPQTFTLLPPFPLQVFLPFLMVLGSEMLVDWLKHAYINKFNAISPTVYGRFLDVLAKDYYSNAFAEQNLTKRLGLPIIPLSCIFIRASLQTYHMFLAQNVPLPITSVTTSLAESEVSNPESTAVLSHIDHIFRQALGRSTFGGASNTSSSAWYQWTMDDVIAFATMTIFFLVLYLFLLAFKLVMGISLLSYARGRYKGMRRREQEQVVEADSKRHGQWSVVEVDEDKRKWIYGGDAEGLSRVRARQSKANVNATQSRDRLDHVNRYSMVAKRIW